MSDHETARGMGEACHGFEELLERAIEERDEALSALREVLARARAVPREGKPRRGGYAATTHVTIRLEIAQFHALKRLTEQADGKRQ